jgi:hypothetical protein
VTRAATQERLDQALTRLLAGRPSVTDGELTISNLCREAGVGRDSYYRTPAVVARFTKARTTAETPGTELARLRDRAATLTRAIKDGKRPRRANHRARRPGQDLRRADPGPRSGQPGTQRGKPAAPQPGRARRTGRQSAPPAPKDRR